MKIMRIAAAAAISISEGSAYMVRIRLAMASLPIPMAPRPRTQLPDTPDEVAQAPVQSVPSAQSRQTILLYVTGSGQGMWLFPPTPNERQQQLR